MLLFLVEDIKKDLIPFMMMAMIPDIETFHTLILCFSNPQKWKTLWVDDFQIRKKSENENWYFFLSLQKTFPIFVKIGVAWE